MRTRLSASATLEGFALSSAPASPRWAPLRSYGVTPIAFESGHTLRLRVVRKLSAGLHRTVWHRPPGGDWVAYVDGPTETGPDNRPVGQLSSGKEATPICLSWSGSRSLTVEMDAPRLRWTLSLGGSPLTRLVNRLLPRLPVETYRRQPALALVRSVSERALGPGPGGPGGSGSERLQVSGQPQRLFLVDDARAEFDGADLGRPLGFEPDTDLGPLKWPALGALVEGEIPWTAKAREVTPPGCAPTGSARPGR